MSNPVSGGDCDRPLQNGKYRIILKRAPFGNREMEETVNHGDKRISAGVHPRCFIRLQ
jgi:hypothetical protein